ncbi:MAG: hypothetical protein HPY69_15990 [Armatimonadetes bacterium]|nr:hypothetical protein [Armatimonadota bacterium]
MRIPARFLRISSVYNGVSSKEGWLEIDIRALDLDGVTKLHVNLDEVAGAKSKRDSAASTLSAWDKAFGKGENQA